jgi:Uma2 family endonuclease
MNKPAVIDVHGADRRPAQFTAHEFGRMIARGGLEGMKLELVGGVIERVAPSYGDHGIPQASLTAQLAAAYAGRPYWIGIDLAVEIDALTVRGIDIAIVHEGAARDRAVHGTDILLAVEIASTPQDRDLGAKAREYATAGIAHYWVVDTVARVVHIMGNAKNGIYAETTLIAFGASLPAPFAAMTVTLD